MRRKPFTVLLLYPDYLSDGQETYLAHVSTYSVANAVKEAQLIAWKIAWKDSDGKPDDFRPLLCVRGHHFDVLGGAPCAS